MELNLGKGYPFRGALFSLVGWMHFLQIYAADDAT
jgi:hypothetical protein